MRRFIRTPAEIRDRLKQAITAAGERFIPRLLLSPVEVDESIATFMAPACSNDGQGAVARYCDQAAILQYAEEIARGRVQIFGHGLVEVGNPPKWLREPISGIEAPRSHWTKIRYLDPSVVGDHKTLWEFNRHQYMVTLAQAYALTNDERWPRLIADHLEDWLDENPPGMGPNWVSSLEVAYRAIAWCWVLRLAGRSPSLQGNVLVRLVASIAAHARHIERYLSTWFSPNTHLTGEALGLCYIGTHFPRLRHSDRWFKTGAGILDSELETQVYSDGVYFELATQYHRYTAEIYLHYHLLRRAVNRPLKMKAVERIESLFDVLLHLCRSDGSMSLIGDDDGGLVLPFDQRPPHILSPLLTAAAAVFNRSDFLWAGGDIRDHAYWLLDHRTFSRLDGLQKRAPDETAKRFPIGGLCVARDSWNAPSGHITIKAGVHGALASGHSHADALAAEVYAGGRPLLVDSGTYTYVGRERNFFRSTHAHNTLLVDGVGSSEPAAAPFRWNTRADAQIDEWTTIDSVVWLQAHHSGFKYLNGSLTHLRALLHPTAGIWVVEDRLDGPGEHRVTLPWHCGVGVQPELADSNALSAHFRLTYGGNRAASVLILAESPGRGHVEPHEVSSQFGKKERSKSCVWEAAKVRDAAMLTIVIDWTLFDGGGLMVKHQNSEHCVSPHPLVGYEGLPILTWNPLTPVKESPVRIEWHPSTPGQRRVVAGPGLQVHHTEQASAPSDRTL